MFCNVYGIVPLCKFCFRVVLKLIFKHKSCVVSFLFSLQRTYIFTFLLSSRLFIHPYELMSKVCHLCMEQQRLGDPQADKVCTTKNVVVNVLGLVVIIVYSVLTCLSHINRWEWGRLLPRSSSCWQSGQKPSRTTLGTRGWCGAWRSWPTGWPAETRSVLAVLCPHATRHRHSIETVS